MEFVYNNEGLLHCLFCEVVPSSVKGTQVAKIINIIIEKKIDLPFQNPNCTMFEIDFKFSVIVSVSGSL